MAVRAVRIGEHGDLARAVALDPLHGAVQRQVGPLDAVQLGQALLREVGGGLRVEQIAIQDVAAGGIGVDDLAAEVDLVQAGQRRLGNALDLHVGAQGLLHAGFDLL